MKHLILMISIPTSTDYTDTEFHNQSAPYYNLLSYYRTQAQAHTIALFASPQRYYRK